MTLLSGQNLSANGEQNQKIISLIDKYAQARETKDTVLLRQILTEDIDQLVSSGEWRNGIQVALDGMMRSSSSNPGQRILTVDKIRFLNATTGIADARYEIHNPDGTVRKMWSTFIVIKADGVWKITAIRNMKPAGNS